MSEDLYDEFGNYIGPELNSDEENNDENDEEFNKKYKFEDEVYYDKELIESDINNNNNNNNQINNNIKNINNEIILHEDKKYYADASEVYPGVKTITLDQDAQDINEPIIKPIKIKNFNVLEKDIPNLTYNIDFFLNLMSVPFLIRNIAIIGHLHHGKTLFLDNIISHTHEKKWDLVKEMRYTDTRKDEQDRCLSIKSTPISLLLQNFNSKSYLFNIIDCPGHVNFSDETTAALRAVDGVVIVIDVVEGVMIGTERVIKQAVEDNVDICICLNKIDRLIVELKLPPNDAYYKLLHTLEEVNKIIADTYLSCVHTSKSNNIPSLQPKRISPELGNVCFSSGIHGWSFTLSTFAIKYCQLYSNYNLDYKILSKRLWGDWYHDKESNNFIKINNNTKLKRNIINNTNRSFVDFILEPIYKIYSQVLGENPNDLAIFLKKINIKLTTIELHLDPKPLLKLVLSKYFNYPYGFVDMCVQSINNPIDGNIRKIQKYYNGPQDSNIIKYIKTCDNNGPLLIHIMKLYSSSDGNKFYALGRIFSGILKIGQKVRVLGENFILNEDEEDSIIENIIGLHIPGGRYTISVTKAFAGNLIMIEGIDNSIKKTATVTDINSLDIDIFKPLKFDNCSILKVAIEPLLPVELPKMVEAMRKISKSYPLVQTKVEESGEHVIIGTGELYMDCILHDLRHVFSEIEIKVADPVVCFCETVVETSALKCYADTPNHRNRLTMLAEPLDNGLSQDIETEKICLNWNKKQISEFFCNDKYEWDLLSSRSIWAFGPDDHSPNILLDDTLSDEVNKTLLYSIKDSIIQGFRWGCREGPLCEEPIRNVKFKLLNAMISTEPIHRGGGQIIPTARRVAYSSFLMATPRLMEPMYQVQIQAPVDVIPAIYPVLSRRRGHVVQDAPKPGTPFYVVKAFIPVMDSFGFETDVRSYTQGQAFCTQVFDHWNVVPGDPLDSNVIVNLLEPSPPLALSKDYMVKTRRRKGLNEEVNINKYIDDTSLLIQINQLNNSMQQEK